MPLLSPDRDRPEMPASAQVASFWPAPADPLEMHSYWQRKRGARDAGVRRLEPAEISACCPACCWSTC